MSRRSWIAVTAGGLAVVLLCGWLVFPEIGRPLRADAVELAERTGSGILDGMEFTGLLGPLDKRGDIEDTLIFANGMFVSVECQKICNYPASPYFVREKDQAIEFVSETRCPYKDATIVWRGQVRDGTLKGVATWKMSRWYWTVEREIAFEGKLAERAAPIASNR